MKFFKIENTKMIAKGLLGVLVCTALIYSILFVTEKSVSKAGDVMCTFTKKTGEVANETTWLGVKIGITGAAAYYAVTALTTTATTATTAAASCVIAPAAATAATVAAPFVVIGGGLYWLLSD